MGVEGAQPLCVRVAKFYVKIAHVYAAIMKTINPVITAKDKNGKLQKYDLMSKQTLPTEAEINRKAQFALEKMQESKERLKPPILKVVETLKPTLNRRECS